MKTIFYDNQIFRGQTFGGISRYFSELINGINASPDFTSIPRKFYSLNKHLRNSDLTRYNWLLDRPQFRGKVRIENYLFKKEDEKILTIAGKGDYDIYHPTYYDPFLLKNIPNNKPVVMTVYDMIHEFYLKDIEIPAYKKEFFARANKIVAISQNTKDDILRLFPRIPENKIEVVYLGSSLEPSGRQMKLTLPHRYVLFVGNRWTYKNFIWFINSVANFLLKENIVLICAGLVIFLTRRNLY